MTSISNSTHSTEPGPNFIPFDRTRKQTLVSKYKSAIKSFQEVYSDVSDNHILYLVDKLEREGKKVDATALVNECHDTDQKYFERDDDSSDGITISELMSMDSMRSQPAVARPTSAATTETSTVTHTSSASSSSSSTPNRTRTAKRRNQSSNGISAGASSTNESFSLPTISNGSATSYRPTQAQNNVLDVVDGAYAGTGIFPYDEDQVDNIHAASFSSTLEPSPSQHMLKSGASEFWFSGAELASPKSPPETNNVQGSEATRAELVKDCLQAVTRENQILETTRTCVLCKVNPRGVTFLPCGHFVSCRECAGPVYVCSLCGKNILATVETYLC